MKRRITLFVLVIVGAGLTWGITAALSSQLFDLPTSRQEIDTMRGILRTTLEYALKDPTQSSEESDEVSLLGFQFGRSTQISGYYLYGQGAVFTIALNALPFSKDMALLAPPIPPVPPVPPVPPTPTSGSLTEKDAAAVAREAQKAVEEAQKQLKLHEKDIAKQLEKVQEQTRHWREQMEGNRAKMSEHIEAAKRALVDALAKHGDSLTVVKPQEYITMIISGDSENWFVHGMQRERTPQQILSVQKSVITDFKAGKLSLEEFKKKVLSYTN